MHAPLEVALAVGGREQGRVWDEDNEENRQQKYFVHFATITSRDIDRNLYLTLRPGSQRPSPSTELSYYASYFVSTELLLLLAL
ncbi:MAG TPA: hypothetical protein VF861_16925 [Telluria sp.]